MSELGIVACYYNPCGFELRKNNYLKFYECLRDHAKDLVTVELAFDDADFHLEHLPNRLAYRSDNVMWQKEALLNKGIEALLERGCEYICWLDADIRFINEDWYDNILAAVKESNLVQVFEVLKRYDDEDKFQVMKSTVASIGQSSPATGFGWASPAHVFADGLRLYDRLVVGGGDTLIYAAAFDELGPWLMKRSYSFNHMRDIVEWSNKWYDKIKCDLGYAENKIETFFHGTLKNRNYINRHEITLAAEFDPKRDLSRDENNLLTWCSDKGHMHESIRNYFVERNEDNE